MKVILTILFSASLLACHGENGAPAVSAASSTVEAGVETVPSSIEETSPKGDIAAMDIDSLIPSKFTKVAVEKGDLNGDGIVDALVLVQEAENVSMISGEGAKRSLLIVLADASGQYRIAKRNEKIVPCKTCGGVSGDPFGYMKVEKPGVFRLVIEGGSRERWSFDYLFSFDEQAQDWMAERIEMEAMGEPEDERAAKKILEAAEIPERRFEMVDPGKLPQPSI